MSDAGIGLLRKVLAILPAVQKKQGIRVAELSQLTGIPEEEIVRDLPALVNLCGVPPYSPADLVDLAVEGDRVSIRFAEQFRRPVRLTLREALALEMTLAGWEEDREGPFRTAVRSIREKVRKACSPDVAIKVRGAGDRIAAQRPLGLGARVVGTLKDSLSRQREVEIEYYSRSRGSLSWRAVRPFGIYEQRGHWYLVAMEPAKGGIRTYRADRIRAVRTTDRDYLIPEEFDVGKFRRDGPPDPGDAAVTVDVVFDEDVARFIEETFPAKEFKLRADGSVRARIRVTGPAWLVSEMMRWGARACVEEPSSVRAEVVERAKRTLELYGR